MQACVAASTPAASTGSGGDERAVAASCPAVASSCGAGCFPVKLHPVDPATNCLLPLQTVGCSPFDTIGPPGVVCSVTVDGTVWISLEARLHPAGRFCSSEEYPRSFQLTCPGTR
jgi:hypothetical protein